MTSASATAQAIDLTLNQTLSGRMSFLIYVKPWGPGAGSTQNTKSMTLYVSNDAGYANYYSQSFIVRSGWNLITMSRQSGVATSNEDNAWTATGSPSWSSAMVRIRIRIELQTGSTTEVYVCNIRDGGYSKPQFIIGFDDQLASAYSTAFPLMEEYGIKGTMYVISSLVGSGGYCTQAQLQEMYDAGWDMGNHTKSHGTGLYAASFATCQTEISDCERYLVSQRWTRRNCHLHFASPFGESTYREADAYREAISKLCLTGRTTQERSMGDCIDDRVLLSALIPDGSTETLQNQLDRITATIGSGGTLFFLFHDIVTSPTTSLHWSTANFEALLAHLRKVRDANIGDAPTLTEWYAKVRHASALTGL